MKKIGKIVSFIVLMISMLLIFASIWVLNTFGNVSVDEIVFTMLIPQKGMNLSVVYSFILEVIPLSIIFAFVLYYLIFNDWYFWIVKNNITGKYKIKKIYYDNVRDNRYKKKNINTNNGLKRLFVLNYKIVILILIFVISFITSCKKVGIFEYVKNQFEYSKFIENEYVDARDVKISFENGKRNLIYIFLESMETTYTSVDTGGVKSNDLIKELSMLADGNVSFSNTNKLGWGYVVPGATWTVGAMVAHTAGVPIKLNIGKKYEFFVPGAYAIGDILRDNGYNQKLMIGSDANFGKRDKYFIGHGGYEIYDLNTAIKDGKMTLEDKVWWGFEDRDLFEWAKEEILELADKDEPFNFTMLTVDTHFEDGYLSSSCKDDYGDQYSNVIACSSKLVYEFVKWVQEQDFYDDTTIVIVGDHLTMDADYFDDLDKEYDRTVYNVFINSVANMNNVKMDNRVFTTLDMFPTTLGAMGASIEGNRLGLGTNLFSDRMTLAEEYGLDYMRVELLKRSLFYESELMVE